MTERPHRQQHSIDRIRNTGPARRWLLTAGMTLLLALSACGFEPIYAPSGGRLSAELAAVVVEQPPGAVGQAMRLAILDGIGDRNTGIQPRYRLRTKLLVDKERVAIQADESAARINVTVNASWTLLDAAGLTTLDAGDIRRTVAYNVVDDSFASLMAERDAERLAGRETGQAIRTRLLLALREK
ncbi:MAG: hypothetical protein P1U65_15620 [Minwuia sp.]|nr:hypothetical protein [Minwuia sp.]